MFLYNRFLQQPIEALDFHYAKTEIYLHVVDELGDRIKSPLDAWLALADTIDTNLSLLDKLLTIFSPTMAT